MTNETPEDRAALARRARERRIARRRPETGLLTLRYRGANGTVLKELYQIDERLMRDNALLDSQVVIFARMFARSVESVAWAGRAHSHAEARNGEK